jgi:hypothetical protein
MTVTRRLAAIPVSPSSESAAYYGMDDRFGSNMAV